MDCCCLLISCCKSQNVWLTLLNRCCKSIARRALEQLQRRVRSHRTQSSPWSLLLRSWNDNEINLNCGMMMHHASCMMHYAWFVCWAIGATRKCKRSSHHDQFNHSITSRDIAASKATTLPPIDHSSIARWSLWNHVQDSSCRELCFHSFFHSASRFRNEAKWWFKDVAPCYKTNRRYLLIYFYSPWN